MAKKNISAYWLPGMATALAISIAVLPIGYTNARYVNQAVWNTMVASQTQQQQTEQLTLTTDAIVDLGMFPESGVKEVVFNVADDVATIQCVSNIGYSVTRLGNQCTLKLTAELSEAVREEIVEIYDGTTLVGTFRALIPAATQEETEEITTVTEEDGDTQTTSGPTGSGDTALEEEEEEEETPEETEEVISELEIISCAADDTKLSLEITAKNISGFVAVNMEDSFLAGTTYSYNDNKYLLYDGGEILLSAAEQMNLDVDFSQGTVPVGVKLTVVRTVDGSLEATAYASFRETWQPMVWEPTEDALAIALPEELAEYYLAEEYTIAILQNGAYTDLTELVMTAEDGVLTLDPGEISLQAGKYRMVLQFEGEDQPLRKYQMIFFVNYCDRNTEGGAEE